MALDKIFDPIFYHFWQMYANVLNDSNPRFESKWAIGICFGFIFSNLINILHVYIQHSYPESLAWFYIPIIIPVLLSVQYYRSDNENRKLISKKPLFFNNFKVSITIFITFLLFAFSSLILGPIISKKLLDNYKKIEFYKITVPE